MAFDDLNEAEKLKAIYQGIAQIKTQLDNMTQGQTSRSAALSGKIEALAAEIKLIGERIKKDEPE